MSSFVLLCSLFAPNKSCGWNEILPQDSKQINYLSFCGFGVICWLFVHFIFFHSLDLCVQRRLETPFRIFFCKNVIFSFLLCVRHLLTLIATNVAYYIFYPGKRKYPCTISSQNSVPICVNVSHCSVFCLQSISSAQCSS